MEVVSLKICGESQEYVWVNGALLRLSDLPSLFPFPPWQVQMKILLNLLVEKLVR